MESINEVFYEYYIQRNSTHTTCYFVTCSGDDFRRRLEFSECGLRKLQTDDLFLTKILFADEATFTNHGQVNISNMHYWSSENLHWLREVDKHRPWSVNVWCGLLNNWIIGPYFCDGIINTARYFDFLIEVLPQSLDDIILDIRQVTWYQHNGCPAHFARRITEVLNSRFEDRWIGRSDNTKWSARSPDLTPLDFYLWGTFKQQVYNELQTLAKTCRFILQELVLLSARMKFNVQYCPQPSGFKHVWLLMVSILNMCCSNVIRCN